MELWRKALGEKSFDMVIKNFHNPPEEVVSIWSSVDLDQVDLSIPLAYVMAPKDEKEVGIIKKACQATQDLFKNFLRSEVMEIIDREKVSLLSPL